MTTHSRATKTESDEAMLQKDVHTLRRPDFKLMSEKAKGEPERGPSHRNKNNVPVPRHLEEFLHGLPAPLLSAP